MGKEMSVYSFEIDGELCWFIFKHDSEKRTQFSYKKITAQEAFEWMLEHDQIKRATTLFPEKAQFVINENQQ